jgi:hypothetical protein
MDLSMRVREIELQQPATFDDAISCTGTEEVTTVRPRLIECWNVEV